MELDAAIPIIIYAKQPIPNREAQAIIAAGASELTTKSSLTPNYVTSVLKKYNQVPKNSKQPALERKIYSNFKLTLEQPNFSLSMS
jgi:hypothetical protein